MLNFRAYLRSFVFTIFIALTTNRVHAFDDSKDNFLGGGMGFSLRIENALINVLCISTNCEVPTTSLFSGVYAHYGRFLGSKHRWDFRILAGYGRMIAHSDVDANIPSKTSLQFDVLADYYFKTSSERWHPYLGFGAGIRLDPGFIWRPSPAIAGGAYYDLTDDLALQMELKVESLGLYTYVEPTVGVIWRF